jgi:putative ABC transport system permease protein
MTLTNLLRHISLKRLKLHKAHTLMSVCGIALGVSAIVSIGIVSNGVVRSFEESITSLAGRASLQIIGGQSGFPETMAERVQGVSGVEYAVPVIETTATLINGENRSIVIIGVDVLQDHHIRDYQVSDETTDIPDPLLFLAKPDSILVSRGLARENNIHMDQSITIETVHGVRALTVRGLLEPEGPAKVMSNSLAVMDIYAAQMAFGKEGRIDRIDVSLLPGENVETVRKRIIAVLPEGYIVDSPAVRSGQIERTLSNLKRNMSTIGLVAMFIGMYLIYNAVSITVVQRRKEIGVLRALGTTRRGIVRLILTETIVLSVVGSVLGIGFGILFAHGSLDAVSKNIAIQYQLNTTTAVPLMISSNDIVTGFAAGILTSILAALFPSFAAARITPVSAIRSLPFSEEQFLSRRKLKILSLLLLLLTTALLFVYGTTKNVSLKYLVLVIMAAEYSLLFGVTFALPTVLRVSVSLFQRYVAPRFGAVSRLAGLNIRKNINRNAVAVGAVFLAISIFISVSNMIFSVRSSVLQWVETAANSDLFITAGHTFSGHARKHVPMPLEMRREIEQIEGVRFTDMYRETFIPFNGSKILVGSIDVRRKLEYSSLMITKGDSTGIGRRLPDQDNVLVSESLAVRHGIKPGDSLVLDTPEGPVSFGVVAIDVDYTYEFGSVLMDTGTYQKHWHDGLADIIEVLVKRKQDIPAVREAILKQQGTQKRLFILSMDEYLQETRKVIDQIYGVFHAMDVLTLSIACLGIIITLLASVLERTREIGVIRSIGALKNQVAKVVVVESVLLGITGGVLGVIVGIILGWMSVEGFISGEAGMSVNYLVDYAAIGKAIILAVVFSALAGLYPARRAAKTNVVEALAYE